MCIESFLIQLAWIFSNVHKKKIVWIKILNFIKEKNIFWCTIYHFVVENKIEGEGYCFMHREARFIFNLTPVHRVHITTWKRNSLSKYRLLLVLRIKENCLFRIKITMRLKKGTIGICLFFVKQTFDFSTLICFWYISPFLFLVYCWLYFNATHHFVLNHFCFYNILTKNRHFSTNPIQVWKKM